MKKLISSCITFIAIIIIANYVAASSYKMEIKSNTQETKKGETITINVELTDYKDIKNGLQAYQGQIEYDTNIFEKIEPDQIELKNGWTSLQYNEENNAFVAIHKTGSLENEIISISLKVKENAKVGETTIKVKGFVASEGKEDINTDESETKINIVEKNNPTPPADENDNNNNSDKNNNNDNDGKNDNNISGNDNKNDNSKNETNNNKEEILKDIEKNKSELETYINKLNAAKIKEEIDLFSAIVKKQKHLLNLNRDIVFWIKIKDYKYKIYYITSFEINYEKIIDARYPSQIKNVADEIKDIISQKKGEKSALEKEKIDYINIINEYLKDTKDRGYIEIRKGE